MPITSWSTTAASNNSASPNGAPEGMAPSGVNDTIRQNMADVRSGVFAVVATKAALQAVTVLAGQVFMLGYYAANDGGGGHYYYDSGSSATDNGGSIIAPTVGAGRWRLLDPLGVGYNFRQFGAKGDDSTNDTTAINNTFIAAIADSKRVHGSSGTYKINSTIYIGNSDGSRQNGFHFAGEGHNETVFKWYGGNTGTAVNVKAILNGVFQGFRVIGADASNKPTIALRWDGGTSSGGHCTFLGVAVGNAATGFKIGGSTQSLAAIPSNSYHSMVIEDCTTTLIDIEGSDTDGQYFYNLATSNAPKVISTNGGRNIHVYGAVHSNPTATTTGYPTFHYFHGEGVLGGAGYSLRDIRCEGGVGVIDVGPTSGDAAESEFDMLVENYVNASIHADIAATYNIVRARQSCTITLRNCHFPAIRPICTFENIARTNRHATLIVESCGFEQASAIDTWGNMITVSGNGGGGTTGGLWAYFKGNYKIAAPTGVPPQPSWADTGLPIPDRNIRVTPDAADAGTPYFLYFDQANPEFLYHDPVNGKVGFGLRPAAADAHVIQLTKSSGEFYKLIRSSNAYEALASSVDTDTSDLIMRPTSNSCGVAISGKDSGGTVRTVLIDNTGVFRPSADNTQNLGASGKRWATVYAGTGTIDTSDQNEKRDIAALNAAELAVATAIKGLIKKFRFNNAYAIKGENSRIHVGAIAQEVGQAFVNAGLDPYRYGIFCRDVWTDENGSHERFGLRYSELLAFVIAAL